ncbi:MAG: hypothetical protein IH623_11380 [Verrucomicrobia bacterium]|nr:hypothetical protein [Verrucomicrobiota bacterium]
MNGEADFLWWAALRHGGCLIAPSRLGEFFEQSLEPLPRHLADQLRRDLTSFQHADGGDLGGLLDSVLEQILGLAPSQWAKAQGVEIVWSVRTAAGENIKPRRLWREPNGGLLPVFTSGETRLGIGRSRRDVARVNEWLRQKPDAKIALLTNGNQWRLIHAGADYDAWCEWDTTLWFEEGEPGLQVIALRSLLGVKALTPEIAGKPSPLVAAILASRRGQAELSSALGERVRQAVELLITESRPVLETLETDKEHPVSRRHVYVAAVRLVMRCVVVLFAEARDLLPRNHPIYHNSYGLQGLQEQLERFSGDRGHRQLRQRLSGWPRILALFRLIHHGSEHEALPVLRYGGGLFTPGDASSSDPVLRALSAFESNRNDICDAAIAQLLDYLTRTLASIRVGRAASIVATPVDFSQLDTEYIGILYEGLLDYELRKADRVPLLFLNLGDQPVLPLDRLEAMADDALNNLVKKAAKAVKASEGEDDEESEDEELDEADDAPADAEIPSPELQPAVLHDEADDEHRQLRDRAVSWAKRAAQAGSLVARPRGRVTADKQREFEDALNVAANKLISRLVAPGEYFLVRWGGTRKGSGTFYTKPALAGPTVRRTLQPLCYASDGHTLRLPNEIIALKVADIAGGSGSFPVAALRYLTRELYDSLFVHQWLTLRADGTIEATLAPDARPPWFREAILDLPLTADNPETRILARLRRLIVERCIYAVDLDPLAVELCRLSLWVETMDEKLPFSFLDHKIKVGNALVGCWFDRFQDYPAMAWEREGGDKNHSNFVHHFRDVAITKGKKAGQTVRISDLWTADLKRVKEERVKPELRHLIESLGGQQLLGFLKPEEAAALHDKSLRAFEELHNDTREPEKQAKLYDEKFTHDPELQKLRRAFDTWCAVWFWPADKLDIAPTPAIFLNPPPETLAEVERLSDEHHFFHWEIEFPDVFTGERAGFDALIGNPPWEIQKPNSFEFFSNVDPLYRTYGKQEAVDKQKNYFAGSASTEDDWLRYNARIKSLSNWTKSVGEPFGVELWEEEGIRFSFSRSSKENEVLHQLWKQARASRKGYSDVKHPFRHQGSADINTYKLFLEQAFCLLSASGRLGMITPSGILSDKGATDLRRLFVNDAYWDFAFGFINLNMIFEAVYYRFKFCIVGVQKGGTPAAVKTAFSRYHIEDWERAETVFIPYPVEAIKKFSPTSLAFVETRTAKDLAIVEKIYSSGQLLGGSGERGWGIHYAREFDMTGDSALFPPRPKWEDQGYRPDEYGHWLKGDWKPWTGSRAVAQRGDSLVLSRDGTQVISQAGIEDIAVPLYEGRMIGQFDFSQKGWVSGKGRTAVWRDFSWAEKFVEPQFLISLRDQDAVYLQKHLDDFQEQFGKEAVESEERRLSSQAEWLQWRNSLRRKLSFMAIGSAFNTRTMTAAFVDDAACGNSCPVLSKSHSPLALLSAMNSLAFDYAFRSRLGGLNLNFFVVAEAATPLRDKFPNSVQRFIAALSLCSIQFAELWLSFQDGPVGWKQAWALTTSERLRLRCILDAVIAQLFGLSETDFGWILSNCDHPIQVVTAKNFMRTLDPKGFWRVDKDQPPELRHTVLAQVAFAELQRLGLDDFLALNNGEGWLLPETLRLADYGLGHDERAQQPQPVAAALGPRFLPWQLNEDVAASWEECRRHAENIRAIRAKFAPVESAPIAETEIKAAEDQKPSRKIAAPKAVPVELPLAIDLFGRVTEAQPITRPLPASKRVPHKPLVYSIQLLRALLAEAGGSISWPRLVDAYTLATRPELMLQKASVGDGKLVSAWAKNWNETPALGGLVDAIENLGTGNLSTEKQNGVWALSLLDGPKQVQAEHVIYDAWLALRVLGPAPEIPDKKTLLNIAEFNDWTQKMEGVLVH